MTRIIDGKAIAAAIGDQVRADVTGLAAAGLVPVLAVVVATGDPGATWYVRAIGAAARRLGIDCRVHDLGRIQGPGRRRARRGLPGGRLVQVAGAGYVHAPPQRSR